MTAPPAVAASIELILGSNLLDIWYAEDATLVGGDVDTVIGRKYGLAQPAISAGQRPTYTASNPNFRGYPTVNTLRTGVKVLLNTAIPAGFLPLGSRPFQWMVARVTANSPSPEGSLLTLRGDATWDLTLRQTTLSVIRLRFFTAGANRLSSKAALGLLPHLMGAHIDPVLGSSLYHDNQLVQTNAIGIAGTPVDPPASIGLGCNGSGTEPENVECAVWGVCQNSPTPTELNAFYAFVAAKYL
jgi:hypothetical protein